MNIKLNSCRIMLVFSCCMLLLLASQRTTEAKPARDSLSRNTSKIKAVVFTNKTMMGYGGMMTFQPVPVVLFKNGEACKSVEAVVYKGGLEAHKRKNPKLWTRWKMSNGKLMLKNRNKWQKVPYKGTYGPMRRGKKLNNSYSRITGTGNTAMGGRSKVTVVENFTFSRDGRFLHKGAGAGDIGFDDGYRKIRTEGYARSKFKKGKYSIDGYILTLRFENGRSSRNFIVGDPKNPKAIWINGKGYTAK